MQTIIVLWKKNHMWINKSLIYLSDFSENTETFLWKSTLLPKHYTDNDDNGASFPICLRTEISHAAKMLLERNLLVAKHSFATDKDTRMGMKRAPELLLKLFEEGLEDGEGVGSRFHAATENMEKFFGDEGHEGLFGLSN